MQKTRLIHLPAGHKGIIVDIDMNSPIRRRLQEVGFTKGTDIECLFKSPLGDPTAYKIKNSVFALRVEDAASVVIELQS